MTFSIDFIFLLAAGLGIFLAGGLAGVLLGSARKPVDVEYPLAGLGRGYQIRMPRARDKRGRFTKTP